MQKEVKLKIADIVFSVIFEDKVQSCQVDSSCKYFLTNRKPDIFLYAHYGYIPKAKLGKKVFDTGSVWSFFRNNGKYILKASSKAVILNSDFKSGDIYIRARGRKPKIEYPLHYPLDQIIMINLLARKRGAMIHSCGVSSKGEGLLFVGTSRAGKSTIANFWKKEKNTTILSDDRIIIRKMDYKFWIYGTPWQGDAKVCSPEKARLKKIFFLRHAKNNAAQKITPAEAVSRLIVCSFPTFWDNKGMEFTLGLYADLAQHIPCYQLDFPADNSVLDFIKKQR